MKDKKNSLEYLCNEFNIGKWALVWIIVSNRDKIGYAKGKKYTDEQKEIIRKIIENR